MHTNLYKPFLCCILIGRAAAGCASPPSSQRHEHADLGSADANDLKLRRFGHVLLRYTSSDFTNFPNIDALVAGIPTVLTGQLRSIEAGRKKLIAYGCDVANEDEKDESCKGNPNGALYESYINLVIRVDRLLKGGLESATEDVRAEWPWPNNADLDEAGKVAPIGAQLLVLGESVPDALEKAKPLGASASVARNLLQIPPYGLIVKDSVGRSVAPLLDDGDFDSVAGNTGGQLKSFDSAVSTIAQVASPQK